MTDREKKRMVREHLKEHLEASSASCFLEDGRIYSIVRTDRGLESRVSEVWREGKGGGQEE